MCLLAAILECLKYRSSDEIVSNIQFVYLSITYYLDSLCKWLLWLASTPVEELLKATVPYSPLLHQLQYVCFH